MIEDKGVIAGNVYDKYGTRNVIARWMVSNLNRTVLELAESTKASTVLDVGCGEGHWSRMFAKSGMKVKGVDISEKIIEVARASTPDRSVTFEAKPVSELRPETDRADLVTCIEVLEHVDDPQDALEKLASLANPYVLLSVPREPWWRIMNVARGHYVKDFGNTPGHANHWSGTEFRQFVSGKFKIIELRHPLPWTVILGQVDKK